MNQSSDPITEPRPVSLHLLRLVPMIVIIGLLVHFLLPRLDSVTDSLSTLRTMAPWAVALAIIMEVLSYLANGALLKSVVSLSGERISIARATVIELAAGTVALVAAGALGFGAAIYQWTRKSGVSRETAMMATWLAPIFDTLTLVLFAVLSAVELLLAHQLSKTTETALAVVLSILLTVIGVVITLLIREEWMTAITLRLTRVMKRIRPSADDYLLTDAADRATRAWQNMDGGRWIRPACCSLMVLTFDLLCLRYAFLASHQRVFLSTLIAGYGVPMLLGRASFLPGGIAVIEVTMTALFAALGVPASTAVVVVLTYRLISFWLPAIIGIPLALGLQSRPTSSPTG
jgi:glycosyltransferase 2 family protein